MRGPRGRSGICIQPHPQAGDSLHNSRSRSGTAVHENHLALRMLGYVLQCVGVLEE